MWAIKVRLRPVIINLEAHYAMRGSAEYVANFPKVYVYSGYWRADTLSDIF